MWVNPWGLWWDEVTASDVCAVDFDANVIEGRWDVTPAIHIHTELHKRRHDARIVVHNHPYYVSLLAATGELPEIVHQTGSMFDGDLRFVDEYTGEIDSPELGADLAERIGDASVVVLANHGVLITGRVDRRGDVPGGVRRPHVPAGLRLDAPRQADHADRTRSQEGDEGVAARARLRRLLGRRRSHAPEGRAGGPGLADGRSSTTSSPNTSFTTARRDGTVTFLPEPERRPRKYTVISVDDHIVEPPHTFEGRVPSALAERAPRSSRRTTAPRCGCTTARRSPTSASTPSPAGR